MSVRSGPNFQFWLEFKVNPIPEYRSFVTLCFVDWFGKEISYTFQCFMYKPMLDIMFPLSPLLVVFNELKDIHITQRYAILCIHIYRRNLRSILQIYTSTFSDTRIAPVKLMVWGVGHFVSWFLVCVQICLCIPRKFVQLAPIYVPGRYVVAIDSLFSIQKLDQVFGCSLRESVSVVETRKDVGKKLSGHDY